MLTGAGTWELAEQRTEGDCRLSTRKPLALLGICCLPSSVLVPSRPEYILFFLGFYGRVDLSHFCLWQAGKAEWLVHPTCLVPGPVWAFTCHLLSSIVLASEGAFPASSPITDEQVRPQFISDPGEPGSTVAPSLCFCLANYAGYGGLSWSSCHLCPNTEVGRAKDYS